MICSEMKNEHVSPEKCTSWEFLEVFLFKKKLDFMCMGKCILLLWNLLPLKQNVRNNGNTMKLVISCKHDVVSFLLHFSCFPVHFPPFPFFYESFSSMWHFNYRAIMKIKKITMETDIRHWYFYMCVVLFKFTSVEKCTVYLFEHLVSE